MNQRPNLLIITADGMRYDALRCNGNPRITSPRLDALADQGTRCERAYCSQPICMPCRSSIMTGRFPSAHGVWQNGIPLTDSPELLTRLLSQHGYRTACVGKTHFTPWLPSLIPDETAHRREHPGEHDYYGFEHIRVVDHSDEDPYFDWVARHFPEYEQLARNPTLDKPEGVRIAWKSTLPKEATKSRYIADHTIAALREQPCDQPFVLWSSFLDPHHPYNPSQPFCDLYDEVEFPAPPSNEGPGTDLPRQYHEWVERLAEHWGHTDTAQRRYQHVRRMYQGKVNQVDHEIGRVLDALEQRGGADNTVIVFLSDHGTMLGDFGLMQVGEYSQEPLVHVPMIWRGPGINTEAASNSLVSAVDVMPTLLDFAGIESPLGVQGQSLRSMLCGKPDGDVPQRSGLLIENRWGQNPPASFRTLVTDRYKLSIYATEENEGELYDLRNDPQEMTNLFNRPEAAAIQARLTDQMLRECLRNEDPLPQRQACW